MTNIGIDLKYKEHNANYIVSINDNKGVMSFETFGKLLNALNNIFIPINEVKSLRRLDKLPKLYKTITSIINVKELTDIVLITELDKLPYFYDTVVKIQNSKYLYYGEIINNTPNGRGTAFRIKVDPLRYTKIYTGVWCDGILVDECSEKLLYAYPWVRSSKDEESKYCIYKVYTGGMQNYKKHGYGVLKETAVKCVFEGTWQNDEKNGYFISTYSNCTAEENWLNNKLEGVCKTIYDNGNIITVEYHNGVLCGDKELTMTYANGDMHKWYVNKDEITATEIIYANGDKYEGSCFNDKRHGYGMMTLFNLENGIKYYFGKWENDKLISGLIKFEENKI